MSGRLRFAAALACGVLAAAGFAAAAFTQSAQEPADPATSTRAPETPTELWGRFPLGESTVEATSPASPAPAIISGDSDEGAESTLLVGLAALAMLLLALTTLGLLRFRQRRLVEDSRRQLLAIMASPLPTDEKVGRAQAFAAGLGCDMVSANRPHARGKQVTEESKVESPKVEAPVASGGYAEFGDRVAAVLQAAEQAAEQIRSDAKTDAEQMTRQAEQESKTLLDEARSEAQRVRVEADTDAKNTREAVESYATNHRREAEEKATKALADAESQARASREAAEAMAQRIEESARSLEEEVREQERMIRGRMQRYLAALRDVSGQIEEVLGETDRGEPALVEALDPEQRAQQESRS
jgi:vacuolar-type H+-ATPase subunit H